MKPTIVLVGRPNVGKSTLFNRMTRSRQALVADIPGLTRDRHYGHGNRDGRSFLVVDTGGFEPVAKDGTLKEMARQTMQAVDEADAVLLLVDARQGLTPHDRQIATELRKTGRRLWLVVNKAEGLAQETATADFHELGLGEPLAVSAAHGEGVRDLVDLVLEEFPAETAGRGPLQASQDRDRRPAQRRQVDPGEHTAGRRARDRLRPAGHHPRQHLHRLRAQRPAVHADRHRRRAPARKRRGRGGEVFGGQDACRPSKIPMSWCWCSTSRRTVSDQDAHLAGFILEAGRALVVAINKWDAADQEAREKAKRDYARKLNFLDFAPLHFISARAGTGVVSLLRSVNAAYAAAMAKLSTPKLTRVLIAAVQKQSPPRAGVSRPKLRYAHQGGMNPPLIMIHGNGLEPRAGQLSPLPRAHLHVRVRVVAGRPSGYSSSRARNPYADRKKS